MATAKEQASVEGTLPNHTRFEKARIVGARALQISMGAPIILAELPEDLHDPVPLAEMEYKANVIPITVRRGAQDVFGQQD